MSLSPSPPDRSVPGAVNTNSMRYPLSRMRKSSRSLDELFAASSSQFNPSVPVDKVVRVASWRKERAAAAAAAALAGDDWSRSWNSSSRTSSLHGAAAAVVTARRRPSLTSSAGVGGLDSRNDGDDPFSSNPTDEDELSGPKDRDASEVIVTAEEENFCEIFEAAWAAFLDQYPELLNGSARQKRCRDLKMQIMEVAKRKEAAEKELNQQLHFLQNKTASLEAFWRNAMIEAAEKQRSVHQQLQRMAVNTAIADHLQHYTLPWFHFVDSMDNAIMETKQNRGDEDKQGIIRQEDSECKATYDGKATCSTKARGTIHESTTAVDGAMNEESAAVSTKPSDRAMALMDQSSFLEHAVDDIELRAYRIDHVLLCTHIHMMRKELERLERNIVTQRAVGMFFTRHNIWRLLRPSFGGDSDDDDTASECSSQVQHSIGSCNSSITSYRSCASLNTKPRSDNPRFTTIPFRNDDLDGKRINRNNQRETKE